MAEEERSQAKTPCELGSKLVPVRNGRFRDFAVNERSHRTRTAYRSYAHDPVDGQHALQTSSVRAGLSLSHGGCSCDGYSVVVVVMCHDHGALCIRPVVRGLSESSARGIFPMSSISYNRCMFYYERFVERRSRSGCQAPPHWHKKRKKASIKRHSSTQRIFISRLHHSNTIYMVHCSIARQNTQTNTLRLCALAASRIACLPVSVVLLLPSETVAPGAKAPMANSVGSICS